MILREVIRDSPRVVKRMKELPKVYLVAQWANYGVREFPFSGRFIKVDGEYVPLVWQFDDHNGTECLWHLRPIYSTTTGFCLTYSFSEYTAERIAKMFQLNEDGKNSIFG